MPTASGAVKVSTNSSSLLSGKTPIKSAKKSVAKPSFAETFSTQSQKVYTPSKTTPSKAINGAIRSSSKIPTSTSKFQAANRLKQVLPSNNAPQVGAVLNVPSLTVSSTFELNSMTQVNIPKETTSSHSNYVAPEIFPSTQVSYNPYNNNIPNYQPQNAYTNIVPKQEYEEEDSPFSPRGKTSREAMDEATRASLAYSLSAPQFQQPIPVVKNDSPEVVVRTSRRRSEVTSIRTQGEFIPLVNRRSTMEFDYKPQLSTTMTSSTSSISATTSLPTLQQTSTSSSQATGLTISKRGKGIKEESVMDYALSPELLEFPENKLCEPTYLELLAEFLECTLFSRRSGFVVLVAVIAVMIYYFKTISKFIKNMAIYAIIGTILSLITAIAVIYFRWNSSRKAAEKQVADVVSYLIKEHLKRSYLNKEIAIDVIFEQFKDFLLGQQWKLLLASRDEVSNGVPDSIAAVMDNLTHEQLRSSWKLIEQDIIKDARVITGVHIMDGVSKRCWTMKEC